MKSACVAVLVSVLLLIGATGVVTSSRTEHKPRHNDSGNSSMIIFQFLEESNFMLWCNWISVAVSFQIFDESIGYHLACMGTPALNARVASYYAGGCDSFRNATDASRRRIYFSKWSVQ